MTDLIIEPFNEPSVRQHTYAHAGAAYLEAFRRVSSMPLPSIWVLLPLLHMSLELLVKAHAARVDPAFEGKKFSHRTRQIIGHYAAQVPAFAGLVASSADLDLVEQVSIAWLQVRYVEAGVYMSEEVFHRAVAIAGALADEHYRETGIEILERHFEAKRRAAAALR